jgi:hypothetical protein
MAQLPRQRTDERLVRFLATASRTASRDDPPPLLLRARRRLHQESGFPDAWLSRDEEKWWSSPCEMIVEESEFVTPVNKRQ